MHCDLKLENVMYQTEQCQTVKIIDLGLSQNLNNLFKIRHKKGTVLYMAPEVIQKQFGFEADIWAAGVLFFILITGIAPFYGTSKAGEFDHTATEVLIGKGKVDYSRFESRDKKKHQFLQICKELISQMLSQTPGFRPTAEDILQSDLFYQDFDEQSRLESQFS